MIVLHANFKASSFRWPFRAGDSMEVWRGNVCVAELSAALLTGIVAHWLASNELLHSFDAASTKMLPSTAGRPPMKLVEAMPARVRDPEWRTELRTRRRSRKPKGGA